MIALALLTPLILIASLGAVWKARPVHAALLLALALALNAVLYLCLGAHFIGLVQFMVYVGAVAILIVFSLLITRPQDEEEELARRPRSLLTGLTCTVPVVAALAYVISKLDGTSQSAVDSPVAPIKELGVLLFTNYAPAVLAVAVLLTAVLIGASLLARESQRKPKPNPES